MKTLLIAIVIIAAVPVFARQKNTQTIPGTLTNATVYYGYGAELNHSATVAIAGGLQEIIINNIATQVDPNTIQVGCPENVVLMSYRFNTKTEAQTQSPLVKSMTDSIKLLQKQQAALYNEYQTTEDVLTRTTKLIENNVSNNPGKEISSAELIKLVEYYTTKVQALKTALYALQLRRNEVDERINDINRRISESNTTATVKTRTVGQLILQVMTSTATNADFNVSYFTRNAGWIPTYDLRIKTLDNSFKLAYKASVSQTTGIDWKDVKLSLSTSNPNQGSTVPIISPWYLNLYVPELYKKMEKKADNAKAYNRLQSIGSALSEVVVTGDGNYNIKDEAAETVESSNVGAYTNLKESQLNTSFDIDLPYNIPTDGKGYSVSIKEGQVIATYKHYAVPKLDRDAFLVAEISDWEALDLLPGDANIVMDNVYLGKSFIDPNTTMDTLNLSLGRDKRVAVKRMLVKDLTKSRIKGDTKTETFTYAVTVKNNKKQAISMLLKDQYPLSKVKEVEVVLEEDGGAEVNAELATLNWKITLQPGESKTYRFSYSIKYPKDKNIQNLR